MEALLGASKGNRTCATTEHFQQQFREALGAKVSPTRAEHVSVTYEFRSTVIFSLTVSESENDVVENSGSIDPSLGGVNLSAGSKQGQALNGGDFLRRIHANDTLVNQPQDDPGLQRAVAKHLINALSQVDGSTWTVRSVSWAAQGWTFIYNCKDSMQTWLRLNAKSTSRLVVGESSGKDGQDPVNLSRPAFDCRGSVTIAFSKSNRCITVKYEHMPLHRTVAQLAELYAPPPAPAAKKPSNKRQAEGSPDGEGSRKKKKKKDSEAATGPDCIVPLEGPGDGSPRKQKRIDKPKKKSKAQNRADQAEAAMNGESSSGASALQSQAAQSGVYATALLNLPLGEARRRRDVAINLLSGSNIDPATLSLEQFNIFANQSPDLQRESLAMLVKYGAERLRIVHPSKDANSISASPAAPGLSNGNATPQSASTVDTPTLSAQKKSRKKKSDALAEGGDAWGDTAALMSKPRITRGKCEGCKARKLKCSKARPSCSECLEAGNACYYPPAKNKSNSLAEDVVEENEEEPEEPDGLSLPGFSQPALPQPELVDAHEDTDNAFDHGTTGWDQSGSALNFPQSIMHGVSHQAMSSVSGMDFSQGNPQNLQPVPSPSELTFSRQPQQPAAMTYPEPAPTAPTQQSRSRRTRSASRRSPPSGQASQSQGNNSTTTTYDAATPPWQSLPHTSPTSSKPSAASPTINQQQQTVKQPRSRKSSNATTAESRQAHDGIQQAAALSPAAIQQPSQPSPPVQQSPFQAPAPHSRAKSRQGQRAQTRKPVAIQSTSRSQQQTSTQPVASSYSTSAATEPGTIPSYDQYSRYSTSNNDQSNSRDTYGSYSNQPTSSATTSTSHPSYDTYNTRSSNTSASYSNPLTQNMSSSYTATSTPTTDQWASPQSRNAHSYDSNASTTSTPSYNMPSSSTQPSQTLESFNVRPQPTRTQTRSSTSASYNQQPEQQQHQYGSYSPQPATSSNQQQNLYGFTPANNRSSGYNSRSHSSGTSSYGDTHSGSSSSYNQNQVHGIDQAYLQHGHW